MRLSPAHAQHGSDPAIDRVLAGGHCVGCGLCAAMAPKDFAMRFDETGMWRAEARAAPQDRARDVSALCPMSGEAADETALAAALFPDLPVHPEIGAHALCGAGWVAEGDFRARGSSGGMLTWLATRLLAEGHVDAVINVAAASPSGPAVGGDGGEGATVDAAAPLFAFQIAEDAAAVAAGAKSRYHSVSLTGALARIRRDDRRFALIALPCFVKAARLAAREDAVLRARLPFMLGLICGHLKTRAFAELLAWQRGVTPDALATLDFRDKLEGRPAADYGFRAVDRDGRAVAAPRREVFGGDWGLGLFKPRACDYCDDVLAETADAAVGDAWLPEYGEDWRGTNIYVVRHPVLVDIATRGAEAGALRLDPLTPDRVAQSQKSGLSHRREGLAFRLATDDRAGRWRPRRRVAPSMALPAARRRIYAARAALAARSHMAFLEAKQVGDLGAFEARMAPLVTAYRAAYAPSPLTRWRRHALNVAYNLTPEPIRRLVRAALGRRRAGGEA